MFFRGNKSVSRTELKRSAPVLTDRNKMKCFSETNEHEGNFIVEQLKTIKGYITIFMLQGKILLQL
jgi:hypothetical protein